METEYLWWFDPNPKKEITTKLDEGMERYHMKNGNLPNVIYVNEASAFAASYKGAEIKVKREVKPNEFHIGREATRDPTDPE